MGESELPCDFSFGGVEMTSLVFFGEVYLVGDWEGVSGFGHGLLVCKLCCGWDAWDSSSHDTIPEIKTRPRPTIFCL